MSNDLVANYSLNPNSISAFTGVNVSEGMMRNLVNNGMRQFASTVKANFAANAGTITTSSILALASISTGDYILLTPSGGSTSISSFGDAPEGLSKQARALGTIILRHDTSKINLPGGSDLTISTGDIINMRALSGAAWNVTHVPYNGVPQSIVNASSVTASSTSSLLILSGGTVQKADAGAVAGLTSGRTYRALSAGYTVSAGDNNAILDFTTAGVTCSFVPLASLSDGFTVTIMNTAATGEVSMSASSIDGFTGRLLRPADRVDLVKTTSSLKTMRGKYSYYSGEQSISINSVLTLAHGLGSQPFNVRAKLRNKITELNYSVSADVYINFQGEGTSALSGICGLEVNDTNIVWIWNSTQFALQNRTTPTANGTAITPANWRLLLEAYILY